MREHAANMLRVVRGAGKPHYLGRQCVEIVDAFHAYREAHGHWPPAELISQTLDVYREPNWERFPDEAEGSRAREGVIRGALQIAASRLLEQRAQISAGEHEMHDGMRRHEKWRDDRLANRRAEEKAATAKASPTRRKRVLKTRSKS